MKWSAASTALQQKEAIAKRLLSLFVKLSPSLAGVDPQYHSWKKWAAQSDW